MMELINQCVVPQVMALTDAKPSVPAYSCVTSSLALK